MANEIQMVINATLANGNSRDQFAPGALLITQAVAGVWSATYTLSTTETTITPVLTTVGTAFFTNMDTTQTIQIGPIAAAVFYPLFDLKPGESGCLRLHVGSVLGFKATAGTPKAFIKVWNN